MRPSLAVVAMAAAFLVGALAAHGCVDRRSEAALRIYVCDPTVPRPDDVCGEGFMCYKAAQTFGQSVCTPKCDPTRPSSCNGVCMANGACLRRCAVTPVGTPDACPPPLSCVAVHGSDAVCLAVKQKCNSSADCSDPIFNRCTSDFDGNPNTIGFCIEGDCNRDSAACEPGSACVRKFLPPGIQPMLDVCAPVCDSIRARAASGTFSECAPGLSCMTDAFPQLGSGFCAPGFGGWLCVDDFGCSIGSCAAWSDIDKLASLRSCAVACKSDDDCVAGDRGSDFLGHSVCRNGLCRNLQTFFQFMGCFHNGDKCEQDGAGNQDCFVPTPDMGGASTMPSGLGAFGGGGICKHACASRDDCADIAKRVSVPIACTPIAGVTTDRVCFPSVPYVTDCADDVDCFGDLRCTSIGTRKTCTKPCAASSECEADPALGTFACLKSVGLCVPKAQSGDALVAPLPADPSFCVSGILGPSNVCVGGPRAVCGDNPRAEAATQCQSGICRFAQSPTQTGRCQ